MPQLYTNGTGATVGGRFVTAKPLLASGNIWYVHNTTGTDAASPAGKSRSAPLKTLQQAVTNAVSGDCIVLLSGSAETVATVITQGTKELFLFGEGTGTDGYPAASLQPTAGNALIDCGSRFLLVSNVKFKPPAAATTTTAIIGVEYLVLDRCRFESSGLMGAPWVTTGSSANRIDCRGTTFVSTATASAPLPREAILLANAVDVFRMDDCTLDGGTYGYSTVAGDRYGMSVTIVPESTQITGLRLLNSVDINLADSRGFVQLAEVTGDSRVVWPATVSLKHHPGGLGGTGHALISGENLITTAATRYVDPVLGNNSSSGLSRDVPLLTIAQALTNGLDGDIVVIVAAGHADNITLSKATFLCGDAIDGEGAPSLGIAATGANPCVTCSVDNSALFNLKLSHSGTSNALVVNTLIDDITVDHCAFALSGNGCGGVALGSTSLRPVFRNLVFSLAGAADTTGPSFAIDDSTDQSRTWLEDILFESTGEGVDAGVTTSLALSLTSAASIAILAAFGLEFRRCRASINSFYDGLVHAETSNGGTVEWT